MTALEGDADGGMTRDSDPAPDPASVDTLESETGVDWPAALALYTAAVAAVIVGVFGVAAGGSSDVILGLVPTAFTGGVLCGAIVARANPKLALRVGVWRWRTVALCLPAVAVAGIVVVLSAVGRVPGNWYLPFAAAALLGIGLSGRLLALVARDAYIGAAIDRKRAATAGWTWHHSGTHVGMLGLGLGLLAVAAFVTVNRGQPPIRMLFLALLSIAFGWDPTVSIPKPGGETITLSPLPGMEYERGKLRAYEAGLVFEPKLIPSYRRFVRWDRITGVGLTEEKLVLERRFRPDIRCDRSNIDDLEGVLRALEARDRAPRQPTV
ncbi:hypothetical protein [Natronorubrum texcoconense]|uniref:Uncharacterized protein n=1 Tax=Natronorubrum texcoconense TaxID=1095776 RepID=A0A1G8TMC5_9EURY|nr:hypothetical protein [Natronorubrum texcoconense]SDJ41830.1 hypothetical protein SAMN04515672_0498 [Natronorubrum texcoconense]